MAIQLDPSHVFSGKRFSNRGVTRRQFTGITADIGRVNQELKGAISEGILPYMSDTSLKVKGAQQLTELFDAYEEIVLIADSSSIDGLGLFQSPYKWIGVDSPDAILANQINEKNRDSTLAVLCTSQEWAIRYCEHLQFKHLVLCIGDGRDPSLDFVERFPDAKLVLEEQGIADPRFILFSSLAFALTGEAEAIAETIVRAQENIEETGLYENQMLFWAALAFLYDRKAPEQSIVFLVGTRRGWSPWLNWASKLWTSMGSGAFNIGNISHRVLNHLHHFIVSDELSMNALYSSPPNTALLILENLRPLTEDTELAVNIWSESQLEVERLLTICIDNGYPHAILQVPQLDNMHLVECSLFWVHSIILLGALRGIDPLSLDGADLWRDTEGQQVSLV